MSIVEKVSKVTQERKERERIAAHRASLLDVNGDYSASGHDVVEYNHIYNRIDVAVKCESHWDACLVLLALGGRREARP